MIYEIITRDQLLNGIRHQTIAHAVYCFSHPSIVYELNWDNGNYTRQDSMGKRACISIMDNLIVGAFYDMKCPRARATTHTHTSWKTYFHSASSEVVSIATKQTSQYLLDNVNNEDVYPCVTTAFWETDSGMVSQDNKADFIECGGSILLSEMLTINEAIPVYQSQYEFNDIQLDIIQKIYSLPIQKDRPIVIDKSIYTGLYAFGKDGFTEFKTTLESINFKVNK